MVKSSHWFLFIIKSHSLDMAMVICFCVYQNCCPNALIATQNIKAKLQFFLFHQLLNYVVYKNGIFFSCNVKGLWSENILNFVFSKRDLKCFHCEDDGITFFFNNWPILLSFVQMVTQKIDWSVLPFHILFQCFTKCWLAVNIENGLESKSGYLKTAWSPS